MIKEKDNKVICKGMVMCCDISANEIYFIKGWNSSFKRLIGYKWKLPKSKTRGSRVHALKSKMMKVNEQAAFQL